MRWLLIACSCVLLLCQACKDGPEQEKLYDQQTKQPPVTRHSQLDSVLDGLQVIPFQKIDKGYLAEAGITAKWKRVLSKRSWYVVRGKQAFQYLVWNFRIEDFMTKDNAWEVNRTNPDAGHIQYLCLDRRVLHRLMDLLDYMHEQKLDITKVLIKHGFRYPSYNARIGGAKKSRHQFGEAIDLFIGDVNRDGRADEEDKAPLLAILDTKIIGDGGGVGRYPDSHVIHLDVRGFRARWDQQ